MPSPPLRPTTPAPNPQTSQPPQASDKPTQRRIGIIGIIITNKRIPASSVNEVLGQYGELIIGRIGVPYKDRGLHVIALIVEASTDEIGALTGRLGMIPHVRVKSFVI